MKTLAIIHTTPSTISALSGLCTELLPGVRVNHYLDESVLKQINEEGCISPGVRYRFSLLVSLVAVAKPEAILCACSSVGGLFEEAKSFTGVPMFRIDEPMAREAAQRKGSVIVCATLASTLEPTLELIKRYRTELAEPRALLIKEAGKYLASDREKYLAVIAKVLREAAESNDTVVLAQASMAEAAKRLPEALRAKLLVSPESGVAQLREGFGV